MTDPLVSIIMRSFNEGWALRHTLPALRWQTYRNFELIVIDSGSTDGSQNLIHSVSPDHFIQLRPEEYNPSRVMNRGMELARADYCVFLNADATPVDQNWLRPLVTALQKPEHAAVYGRQIPRPDCRAVFAHDYERCFGERRESAQWDHFFSMVSSGLRRDVWSQRGFLEKMQYSEDDEYTRWCRAHGYKVVYCPDSTVIHSHNYTPAQAYRRSYGEGRALAAVWERDPAQFNWPRTVLGGWLNDIRRDFRYCARQERLSEWPHAVRIRWNQRRARLAGFRDGWSHYRTQQDGENPHPLVTGFGMAGDERMHHPRDFARAFDVARDAGLGITVHAGELSGWESVANALDAIRPSRIGHGVRAIENPDLVRRLAEEQILLECCPGSNISLQVYADFPSHPFPALARAGVPVTLNSDDPPYFHTDLAREYDIAAAFFGCDDGALTEITRTALKAAYVDETTRNTLIERLDADKTVRAGDADFAGSVASS